MRTIYLCLMLEIPWSNWGIFCGLVISQICESMKMALYILLDSTSKGFCLFCLGQVIDGLEQQMTETLVLCSNLFGVVGV